MKLINEEINRLEDDLNEINNDFKSVTWDLINNTEGDYYHVYVNEVEKKRFQKDKYINEVANRAYYKTSIRHVYMDEYEKFINNQDTL